VSETETVTSLGPLDIGRVMAALPHRYPMLLVDRVEELILDRSITAIKAVTINEGFFQGHFPGRPIMPGVLIVEALAQTGGIALGTMDEYKGRIAFFAGIDNVRFKRQVKPGDTLRLEVELTQLRRSIGTASALATVDGEVACKGDIMFALGPLMSELT
jgi:3-hydroxyacyl-[acyl-carrier-protein] dehydratase